MIDRPEEVKPFPIAIVGIGCRLPGDVNDPESFWSLLMEGRSGICEVPSDRWSNKRFYHSDPECLDSLITKWGGFARDVDKFDPRFWGLSPREAVRMDPQQRWLLEAAWESIEDSGTAPSHLRTQDVGVFVGIAGNDYGGLQVPYHEIVDAYTNSGSTSSIASNRISYMLDLTGPSLSVDTACSSSLVAVWLACESMWQGRCSASLVGGVNAIITPHASIGFSRASMLSRSGQCFAFDSRANGYVRGEGVGVVYLKPLDRALADNQRIYAVIRGAAANQDGHTSSMTVPGVEGQSAMLRKAYALSGVDPKKVVYVEAHGTGTPVGDPIELTALGRVLGKGRAPNAKIVVGSVKTNIGHLEAGSGIAGLIKAALVLHHRIVPKNANFREPNPNIPFDALSLRVAEENQPLPQIDDHLPIVGVNSFGFGGTNAHVVLEAAPVREEQASSLGYVSSSSRKRADRPLVLPISARDDASLHRYAEAYWNRLGDPSLAVQDFCTASGTAKEHHERRLFVSGKNTLQLRRRLRAWFDGAEEVKGVFSGRASKSAKELTFVYTGQGAQWWAMGQQLLDREPLFLNVLEEIDAKLKPFADWSLLDAMRSTKDESPIDRTNVAQPAIFALQVGLTKLWESWGISPSRVIGHSVGEVAAAYCAGIYSLDDAVTVIFHRSRLQHSTGGHGRMLAVGLSQEEANRAIGDELDRIQVAVINNPNLVTLAGDTEPLERLAKQFEEQGRFMRWLPIDYAFHTHQMEPIRDELLSVLQHIEPRKAKVPFFSTVTAKELHGTKLDAEYWWKNVRETVLFGPTVIAMLKSNPHHFLEIGPHPALASSLRDCLEATGRAGLVLHSLRRETDETNQLFENLSQLYIEGFPLDWKSLNIGSGEPVRLPTYPFARDVCWLETDASRKTRLADPDHPLLGIRAEDALPTWRTELDLHRLSFLNDHRLWDAVVFPGAGYVEIGLAIARHLFPKESLVVEDVTFHKAMFVSQEDPPQLQITWSQNDRTFSIYSRPRSRNDWELNATGRLIASSVNSSKTWDLNSIASTLPEHLSKERMYSDFLKAGFQFGPNFQLLDSIFRGINSAIGDVTATELVQEQIADFEIHPSVLDACFQISAARPSSENATDDFLLPAKVRRVQLFHAKPPCNLRAYAIVTLSEPMAIECDIALVTEEGECVVQITGFRAERAPQSQSLSSEAEKIHYQTVWSSRRHKGFDTRSPKTLPSPASWVETAHLSMDSSRKTNKADIYSDEFIPKLNAITPLAIQNAYLELGWEPKIGQTFSAPGLVEQLGILPKYERLVSAQLAQLASLGTVSRIENNDWQIVTEPKVVDFHYPLNSLQEEYGFSEEFDLIRLTGTNMASVLCGEVDPVHLLFPHGSNDRLRNFYMRGSDISCMHEMIRHGVREMVKSLGPNAPLRVLEVGGGTASLTKAIIGEFPADQTEYVFTDLGAAFLNTAKETLSEFSFVDFKTFDLEKDPVSQGLTNNSFDLILATNVIHATADLKQSLNYLKSLLYRDGVLLFVEVTERVLYPEGMVFGLLDGWWRFTDTELRKNSPLLRRDQWQSLLSDSGFLNATSFSTTPCYDDAIHIALVARGPAVVESPSEPPSPLAGSSYVVLVDEQGLGEKISSRLSQKGARVFKVRHGSGFAQVADDQWVIHPMEGEHYARVMELADTDGNACKGIIHCWSANEQSDKNLSTADLQELQRVGVMSALRIGQLKQRVPSTWYLVDNVYPVLDTDRCEGIAASPIVGFSRVANNEHYPTRTKILDLGSERSESLLDDCVRELLSDSKDTEVAFRSGVRYLPQLERVQPGDIPLRKQNAIANQERTVPFRLESRGTGILTNLCWNATSVEEPGCDEIAIQVEAGGINFRDVMKALATYPGNPVDLHWYGDDFAGTVVAVGKNVDKIRVGDRVAGMAPYAFQSRINVDARMVFPLPESMGFEEAATLPTVFLTAHYAMHHLARMMPGESILIHGGTGGVGQAAIQIARKIGLTIFATAGSDEKRRLLQEQGVHHVLNSRTLEFSDRIRELTSGKGVDAVLNSLAGEFIPKSLELLAPYGRFLEIGKIDVYGNSKLGMIQLKDNISFFVIDLGQHHICRRSHLAQLFEELSIEIGSGHYRPLPYKTFPISQCTDAFRYMAQGKHIGKNVLTFRDPSVTVGPTTSPKNKYRADGTYLITGGASGFCLELAKSMVEHGARHLVLMSRSGPRDEPSHVSIERMRELGAKIVDARGDVSKLSDVQRVVATIQDSMPTLVGVLHGAMLLDDEFIAELTAERFDAVLQVKAIGGWNLHWATLHLSLEDFICFSSVSSLLGAPRQSNYNAGNYFLDALAHYRRARGLPSLTIDWGALRGAGFVERNQKTAEYLEKTGLLPIPMKEAVRAFHQAVEFDTPQVSIATVDWNLAASFAPLLKELSFFEQLVRTKKESGASGSFASRLRSASADQRLELTKAFIAQQIAGVFGIAVENVEHETPLNQMGLDSLMAIELKNRVEKEAAISMPMNEILSGPTLLQLAKVVLTHVENREGPGGESESADEGILTSEERQSAEEEGWSPLEQLQSINGNSPLFCIHPLGGTIQCYADLARYSSGRPIVAVKGRGGEGQYDPHLSMEEMMDDYLKAIRTVQASGPYHLVGWSAGGIFAYELARILTENGEEVGTLTLLDTPLPSIYADVQLDDDVRFMLDLGRFANWFKGTNIEIDSDILEKLGAMDEDSRWQFASDLAQSSGALPRGVPISYFRKVVQAAKAHATMISGYDLKPIDVNVLLVRPMKPDVLSQMTGQKLDHDLGWKAVLEDRLQLFESPGDHFTMMEGENASALANIVTRIEATVSE